MLMRFQCDNLGNLAINTSGLCFLSWTFAAKLRTQQNHRSSARQKPRWCDTNPPLQQKVGPKLPENRHHYSRHPRWLQPMRWNAVKAELLASAWTCLDCLLPTSINTGLPRIYLVASYGTKKPLPWFLLQTHHQLHKVGLHPGMSLRCRRCHLRPSRCISAIWPVMTCAVGSSSINTCETLQSPQAGERHLLNHHPMDLRPRSAPCTVTSQYWSPTHDWSSCCFPHMEAYRGSGLYLRNLKNI